MKRFVTIFALALLIVPSVGFADVTPPDDVTGINNQVAENRNAGSTSATTEEVRAIADANDAASAAEWTQSSTSTSSQGGTPAPASGNCNFDPDDNQWPGAISAALKGCKPKWVIETKWDYVIESGVRSRIIDIANNLIYIGSILAVGAIVYAALLYTIAAWDEERIKSAKNALKFGIIGFAVMLISFGLVNAVVRLFYSTSGG